MNTEYERELEQHIRDCDVLIKEAMARYAESSSLLDVADADRWRLRREEAVRSMSLLRTERTTQQQGPRHGAN